ncbi:hypothetical protein [Streptomyces sp. AM8-1-1]|uniref:hypothetical protein n=1 Tax=Streptomyces sp. AM8-1-1 TaxID=3075825 RepID=UPI0028C3A8E7|nr:hypothetical protein [Streptomyces sp. AM8-1-1]WNO70194.1 hypothetical protein RPQ07_00440 [Streptomyces sp. AM8-1-1]
MKETDNAVIWLTSAGSGDPGSKLLDASKDLSSRAVNVKARSASGVYYVAHLKVTGPISTDVEKCRYEYQQDGKRYTQTIGCRLELRLKK